MNRKKLSYIGIGLAAGLLLIVVGIIAQRSHRSANDGMSLILHDEELAVRRLQLAKAGMILQAEMAAVPRNLALSFWGRVVLLGSFSGSLLILAAGGHRAMVKARSVHQYQIGGNVFFVHERDLSIAAPIAMGLVNAENLKQMAGGEGKALQLAEKIANVQLAGLDAPPAIAPVLPASIPSFQTLIESGEIARDKPMILGYENGAPRRGSFLDIYSAAVAGESGSGKTSTMLFLIGSGIIAEGVRFMGIDPHYPHPKSLGFKTRPLWEVGLMQMATNIVAMQDLCEQIDATIDARLAQRDKDVTPVVLVIDELAFLAKSGFGKTLAHTMERVSMEGRKCAVYMLASSQTWLADRTGGSSVVRDTLTSAFVHRIKPKQANLLLQDKDEAEKVKKYVKQPGDVLLCPVNDDSIICQIPQTTEDDMRQVARLLAPRSTLRDKLQRANLDEVARKTGIAVERLQKLKK